MKKIIKIRKSASGKKVTTLTHQDWEDFGKQAGWINEDGKLIASAEDIEKESSKEVVAQPVTAPPKPKAPPQKTPTERPIRRRRRNPTPLINPRPKAKEVEEEPLAASNEEEEITIASELKRLLK